MVIKPRPHSIPPARPRPLEAGACPASCHSMTWTVPGTNRGFAHRMCGTGRKRKGRRREARGLVQDHTAACPPGVTAGLGPGLIRLQHDFSLLLHLLEASQPPLDHSLSRLPPPSGAREAVRSPPGSSVDCSAPAACGTPSRSALSQAGQPSGAQHLWASPGLRCVLCNLIYSVGVCTCVCRVVLVFFFS